MNPLLAERFSKVERIQSLGIEPYATKFSQTHKSDALSDLPTIDWEDIQKDPKREVALAGRLMTFREHGRLSFGNLQDEKGVIQLCFLREFTTVSGLSSDDPKEHERFWKKLLDLGDFLGVRGDLFLTKHGQLTLLVKELHFLSKSLLPLPEKFHGLANTEQCYRERNLDLVSNAETKDRFLKRSEMVWEIRQFFQKKSFHEVQTRTLQPQAGGAMAQVFNTHHHALDHDFVLNIALELDLKRIVGGGFERIFEIGKCFRNEGSDPSHLQEFTMLEWYAAYQDLETNKQWTEELLHHLVEKVFGTTILKILGQDDEIHEIDFSEKFAEARFPDLLQEYANVDMFTISDENLQQKAQELGIEEVSRKGRATLLDDIYKKTARLHIIAPTFVFDYPEELKPLARPRGDGTAECFQLLIGGWEVVNSYGELIDPAVQRKLFESQSAAKAAGDAEAMEIDEDFLKAMEHGFPPMTGSGIGIDRLIALLTAQENLRDVVFFPTMKPDQGGGPKEEFPQKSKGKENPLPQNNEKIENLLSLKNNEEKIILPDTARKFVAVLNKKIEIPKLMNALGHMAAGISGAHPADKNFLQYQDADEGIHPNISHFPFIILRADNGNKIRTLRKQAQELGVECVDFTESMSIGTSAEQLEKTAEILEQDLEYFGMCLFGETEKINTLTKKFSLWR